jgi:hypothetical protein
MTHRHSIHYSTSRIKSLLEHDLFEKRKKSLLEHDLFEKKNKKFVRTRFVRKKAELTSRGHVRGTRRLDLLDGLELVLLEDLVEVGDDLVQQAQALHALVVGLLESIL